MITHVVSNFDIFDKKNHFIDKKYNSIESRDRFESRFDFFVSYVDENDDIFVVDHDNDDVFNFDRVFDYNDVVDINRDNNVAVDVENNNVVSIVDHDNDDNFNFYYIVFDDNNVVDINRDNDVVVDVENNDVVSIVDYDNDDVFNFYYIFNNNNVFNFDHDEIDIFNFDHVDDINNVIDVNYIFDVDDVDFNNDVLINKKFAIIEFKNKRRKLQNKNDITNRIKKTKTNIDKSRVF